MRTETNRKKINRLYILGAGSSYALTEGQSTNQVAPLDSQFCERINTLKECKRPVWVSKVAERIQDEYLHHVDFQSSGLEDLIHLVSFALSRARAKDQLLLENWLKKYFKGTKNKPTKNRITSFNYDTLIDDVLQKWNSPQHIYFDNIWNSPSSPPKRLINKYPLLLKLHGSLNWRCSTTEYNKLFNNSVGTGESKTTTYNTKGCHYIDKMWLNNSSCKPTDDETPLIIPPLPQKPITSIAIFRYLWTYAHEYLYEAQNIIVAGYSLPPTDTLAVSLFSKFKNKKINNLTIIDPDEEVLGKWIKLFRRNGIKSHKVHYFPDFYEYIKSET